MNINKKVLLFFLLSLTFFNASSDEGTNPDSQLYYIEQAKLFPECDFNANGYIDTRTHWKAGLVSKEIAKKEFGCALDKSIAKTEESIAKTEERIAKTEERIVKLELENSKKLKIIRQQLKTIMNTLNK